MKRELGVVTMSGERPVRVTAVEQALASKALAVLREEVAHIAAQRAEAAAESERGAPSAPPDDGASRLEGMARFALRMGLVTPAEVREVFVEAGIGRRGGRE